MSKIKLFESKQIRSVWNETDQKWYFAVADVVEVLTDSSNPTDYLKKLKKRDPELSKGWGQIVTPLLIDTAGGKQHLNCANAEGLLRLIQSIPSPKAEPFKRWLAKVGYERLEEIDDPELASKRAREIYQAKGYPDDWIEKRMRSIAIREELTDEWSKRGINGQIEYAILTAEISKATFGLTPSEYKKVKNLKRENLRDHMTDLELIFSMLGEASTTKIARAKDARGFDENEKAAVMGGTIAGNARKALESESGEKVVTSDNYLPGKNNKQIKSKN
ncbi:MAG TPA: Bro-N domain-containing protein [Candidatus Deferrimicrobium sp.]|nr:Bro-N domain-containing protein [Candidatus Deferrimicrobium sp.]